MTKLVHAAITIALCACFAACSSDEGPDPGETIAVWDYAGAELVLTEEATLETTLDLHLDEAAIEDVDSDLCQVSADSLESYIIEVYGCGICVDATCDGTWFGGCFPCTTGG